MNEDRNTVEKKKKLYFVLTVAEIILGIVGIALFVALCRTEEDIRTYIIALLLALVMIVSGTSSLIKILKSKKEEQTTASGNSRETQAENGEKSDN